MSTPFCRDRGFASIGKYALGVDFDTLTQDHHVILGLFIAVSCLIFRSRAFTAKGYFRKSDFFPN